MKSPCLLIFGHGYTASALVDHLGTEDWEIFGTTRNVDTADLLKENNITPLMWSDDTSIKSVIKCSNCILHSIAPTEVEDPVYEKFAEDIIARSINLSWVGYLSTTSVYGNHDG